MPHATKFDSIKFVPLAHGKEKSGVKFGAEVYGADLNDFSGTWRSPKYTYGC
jgi:hypothetical protein